MEKIKINDFFNYKFLSKMAVNKDTGLLSCVVSGVNENNNEYKHNIFGYQHQQFKKLTALNKENSYVYLDKNTILFSASRDQEDENYTKEGFVNTSFYSLSLDGGEAIKAFCVPLQVVGYDVLSSSKLVLQASIDVEYADYHTYTEQQKKEISKKKKDNSDYEVFDEIPWWSNGGGFTNKKRVHLFIYDIETNQLEVLCEPLFNVGSVYVDAKENKVLFTGSSYKKKPEFKGYLYEYDGATKKIACLVDGTQFRSIREPRYLSDTILFAASTAERFGNNENPYFYKIDRNTKELTCLVQYQDSLGSTVGSDCRLSSGYSCVVANERYYFLTTIGYNTQLCSIDSAGNLNTELEVKGSIDMIDIHQDKIYFVGMLDLKLQEIYCYQKETKKLTQLSKFNEEVLENKYVAKLNHIKIESKIDTVDGWIMLPKDYDATKKYPAILDIHGGPKTVYGEVFFHEMQYWANEGYFVMFCNPTGSDGKKNEFADIRGKYGTIDFDDIMYFVDEVLKSYPAIDKQKVAVTGGSYGGFMTNWIITHTDRFVCAASQRSISNWFSMYGTCDIGFFFAPDQMDAEVYSEQGQEKMWWHSPLKYVKNAKTPTLFIHSSEDYRCWIPEAMQMYTAMSDNGVDTRLCYFKGENHELSRSGKPLHRERRLQEITSWINKYCK